MPVIDLGSPRPTPVDLLDGLPRRVALTLPELRYVARRAGDAPLPFDLAPPPAADPLTDRLGRTREAADAAAYVAALGELHDAATSLGRRGLLVGTDGDIGDTGDTEGVLDAGLCGAVGLLATPAVALDLDVAAGGVHARSWQRQSADAVATLSTVDGIVFELAWFATAAWPDELTRATVVPEDVVLTRSAVPGHLTLPFELADAAGEALRTSRADLVPVLVAQHSGATTDAEGRALEDAEVVTALTALSAESQGRLRVLVADVSAAETHVVGVVSWTLVADGWRALRPHRVGEELHVEVRRVGPADLPGDLAPVLAEVLSGGHAVTGRDDGPSDTGKETGTVQRARPGGLSLAEAAELQDKYDQMMRLADVFDASGEEMRAMSRLGAVVLRDPALTESAPLARPTYAQAEDDVRAATTGRHGLLTRSIEVDADALVLRATVLTYRWIDELQSAAYETLGAIAGRAIGYLAPNVALGGAIVSAGLIETDALDRDGVATYLSELAEHNPELMDHVLTGGGGLLDGLQMRSLLTAGVLAGDSGRAAAHGGLRAIGVTDFGVDSGSALRDVAGGLLEPTAAAREGRAGPVNPGTAGPRGLADLMIALEHAPRSVGVHRVSPGRFIAYLSGPGGGHGRRLRLVGGDSAAYAAQVVRAIEAAVRDDPGAHVMLVGSGAGGTAAAEIAATVTSEAFVVDQVVTAGAPSAQVPRIPAHTRVLSLEDRSDPVALLGSLVNAGAEHRTTVVFDGAGSAGPTGLTGVSLYVAGARAADATSHPGVRAEIARLRQLGFLGG